MVPARRPKTGLIITVSSSSERPGRGKARLGTSVADSRYAPKMSKKFCVGGMVKELGSTKNVKGRVYGPSAPATVTVIDATALAWRPAAGLTIRSRPSIEKPTVAEASDTTSPADWRYGPKSRTKSWNGEISNEVGSGPRDEVEVLLARLVEGLTPVLLGDFVTETCVEDGDGTFTLLLDWGIPVEIPLRVERIELGRRELVTRFVEDEGPAGSVGEIVADTLEEEALEPAWTMTSSTRTLK